MKKSFVCRSEDFVDSITRGGYEALLLAKGSGLDVFSEAIPPKVVFYVDSGTEWPGFEFIYILDGHLRYLGDDSPTPLGPGDYIVRHLAKERSYFETDTPVVLLHICSPAAFELMREEIDGFFEMASKVEADEYLDGHCKRLETVALSAGEKLGLSGEQLGKLSYAAFFHDIGKSKVPRRILQKPKKLTKTEWGLVKRHATWGKEILETKDFLKDVAVVVEQTHERVDGKGYPRGLKGDEIMIEAKILAAVDAFDAMINDRPYRKARSVESALQELQENAGSQFDEKIVEAITAAVKERDKDTPQTAEWITGEFSYLKLREAFLKIAEDILFERKVEDILQEVVSAIVFYTPLNEAVLVLFEEAVGLKSRRRLKVSKIAFSNQDGQGVSTLSGSTLSTTKLRELLIAVPKISRSYYVSHSELSGNGLQELISSAFEHKAEDNTHFLILPMFVGVARLIGLLIANSGASEAPPSEEVLEPVEMFVNLAALGLQEARRKDELGKTVALLTEMAISDPLTGLYNRHYLIDLIEKEKARAERTGNPISLLMMDFVDFHNINTRFGHLVGDRVLKEAAEAVRGNVRKNDSVIRYGGDEFLVFMPDTREKRAHQIANRIKECIRGHDFGISPSLAVRIGIATWNPATSADFSKALDEADQWLYQHGRVPVANAVVNLVCANTKS